jgi:hypothetical protein
MTIHTPQPVQPENDHNQDPERANRSLAARDLPIIVWRTTDDPIETPAVGDGLPVALARRLVTTYTLPGECVVDCDADPGLRQAADRTGRRYIALARPADIADLDAVAPPPTLVVVRWPRLTNVDAAQLDALFDAYRLLLADQAFAIVAIATPLPAGEVPYVEHAARLEAAGGHAGFTTIHTILAITMPVGPDTFTYYATVEEADAARLGTTVHDDPMPGHLINLLVFAADGERRSS